MLRRSTTMNDALILPGKRKFSLNFDLNDFKMSSTEEEDRLVEEKSFIWDWPFSADRIAQGMYTRDKFLVVLPFNRGGTGTGNGTTKKFDRMAESNFIWTMGLSRDDDWSSTCFWRLEIEVQRNLNSLVLIASREISRIDDNTKRLKRIRKVYRLPDHYDVATTTTTMYDWAVVVEAQKRTKNRPILRRGSTMA